MRRQTIKSVTVIAALLVAAALGAGCVPTGGPPPPHHAVADENFNAVWDATTEVLCKYRFTIDRADRRAGVITTLPMIGRHWFEFWREDAITRRDVAEGALQTIYRQVTVNIRRTESPRPAEGGEYLATVQVRTSRSNLPNVQITSVSEAYDLFLYPTDIRHAGSMTGLGDPTKGTAVRLGRDENLERILQREINFVAAKKLTIYQR